MKTMALNRIYTSWNREHISSMLINNFLPRFCHHSQVYELHDQHIAGEQCSTARGGQASSQRVEGTQYLSSSPVTTGQ